MGGPGGPAGLMDDASDRPFDLMNQSVGGGPGAGGAGGGGGNNFGGMVSRFFTPYSRGVAFSGKRRKKFC